MTYTIDRTSYRRDLRWPLGNGYGERSQGARPRSMVIHTTNGKRGSSFAAEAAYLRDNHSEDVTRAVSSHYLVGKAGQIAQILPDHLEANHAGATIPGFQNDVSLGIECHLTPGEAWSEAQREALTWLVRQKLAEHQIPIAGVETHRFVAVYANGSKGRKTDPAEWSNSAFYAWRATELVVPTPPPPPPTPRPRRTVLFSGVVLTHVFHFEQLAQAVAWGGYDAVKVITGWGLPWDDALRARLAGLVDTVVVRTVAGDTSYQSGAEALPIPERVAAEIAPWLRAGVKRLYLEIGNEPKGDDDFIWRYRHNLLQTRQLLARIAPRVPVIAPALEIDGAGRWRRWLELCADVFRQFDAAAIHLYEHDAWHQSEQRAGTTWQAQSIVEHYAKALGTMPLIVTEYGINDANTALPVKARRYAALVKANRSTPPLPDQVIGYLAYHLCADEQVDPNYGLGRLFHETYAEAMR